MITNVEGLQRHLQVFEEQFKRRIQKHQPSDVGLLPFQLRLLDGVEDYIHDLKRTVGWKAGQPSGYTFFSYVADVFENANWCFAESDRRKKQADKIDRDVKKYAHEGVPAAPLFLLGAIAWNAKDYNRSRLYLRNVEARSTDIFEDEAKQFRQAVETILKWPNIGSHKGRLGLAKWKVGEEIQRTGMRDVLVNLKTEVQFRNQQNQELLNSQKIEDIGWPKRRNVLPDGIYRAFEGIVDLITTARGGNPYGAHTDASRLFYAWGIDIKLATNRKRRERTKMHDRPGR